MSVCSKDVRTIVLCFIGMVLGNAACTPPGFTLEGRLLDAQHQPVPAARIIVVNSGQGHISYISPDWIDYGKDKGAYDMHTWQPVSERGGRCSARARTDRDGRFCIRGLAADTYHLLAVHPKMGVTVVSGIKLPGGEEPVQIELPAPTFLSGKIHGYKRGPSGWWHGAEEMLHLTRPEDDEGDPRLLDETGEAVIQWDRLQFEIGLNGDFRVGPLPAGGLWRFEISRVLHSRMSGGTLLSLPVQIEPGQDNVLEVDLRQGYELAGRVIGPEGQPLSDVGVEVQVAADDAETGTAENETRVWGAITDRQGKFVIRGIPRGRHKLSAHRNSKRPWDRAINPAHFCGGVYRDISHEQEVSVPQDGDDPLVIRIDAFLPDPRESELQIRVTGKRASGFSLSSVDGKTVTLSNFKDKQAVLVAFWGTWCLPCQKEIPTLVKLHEEFGEKGLAVVGINVGQPVKDVASFVKKRSLPYAVLCDEKQQTARAYGATSVPYTVLIDQEGVVVRTWQGWEGGQEEKEIREELGKLLGEKANEIARG